MISNKCLSALFVLHLGITNFLSSQHEVMASSDIAFGSLSNFDVFCVTENIEECHGFEIELEGIDCDDITRTFGGTYSRYGVPDRISVTDSVGNVTACIVEYSSPYDSSSGTFDVKTVVPPELLNGDRIGTNGHQCYLGGMNAVAYDSSGCEHFGVSLRKSPTKTSYYWLVADPQHQGQLKRDQAVVGISGVTWSAQNNGGGIVVRAEIEPPEQVFQCAMFGEAKWVKVNVTEYEVETELDELLSDNPKIVEAESEVEWKIMQARPTCDEDGQPLQPHNEFAVEAEVGDGSKTVIRRYEFFEYVGAYDPENHEVIPLVDEDSPQDSEIGNFLGSQMAAINFEVDAAIPLTITTSSLPKADVGEAYDQSLEASGGTSPYTWTLALANNNQKLPDGLTLTDAGVIQGTPTTGGSCNFRVQVTDTAGASVYKVLRIVVLRPPLAIVTTSKTLPRATRNVDYQAQIEVIGGRAPYTFSITSGALPTGMSLNTNTGVIQGMTTSTKVKNVFRIKVQDSKRHKKMRKLILRVQQV